MPDSVVKRFADFVVNKGKVIEETLSPDYTLLNGFTRSLQLDGYSCGAQSAFVILRYYGKARSVSNVTKKLGTTEDGTTASQLRSLFLSRRLRPVTLRSPTLASLRREINLGNPVLVSVDGDHWAVVYGYGRNCVFVADPAVNRAFFCRHSTHDFRNRWDKWAMAVRT